jgi:hypothetical protein
MLWFLSRDRDLDSLPSSWVLLFARVFSRDPIFSELFLFVPRSSFFFTDFIFGCSYFAIGLELRTGASLICLLSHRWMLASASRCLLFLQSLGPVFTRLYFFGAHRSVLVERSSETRQSCSIFSSSAACLLSVLSLLAFSAWVICSCLSCHAQCPGACYCSVRHFLAATGLDLCCAPQVFDEMFVKLYRPFI